MTEQEKNLVATNLVSKGEFTNIKDALDYVNKNPDSAKTILATLISSGAVAKDTKTTTVDAIKLTTNSAKQLLENIAKEIQYTGTFSNADINSFVTAYNKKANEALDTVVREIKTNTTGTLSGQDVQTVIQTKYPNFFDPKTFTKDYLWAKVNFADEKTLGAKAIDALASARAIVKSFNLTSISDAEIQDAARKIAKGDITENEYKIQLSQKAAIEYPQLADRYKANPGISTKEFLSPILNAVAKAWEVDPNSLDLNDPFIDKLIRPDGPTGKVAPVSVAQATLSALNHPNREKTLAANNEARTAATALASAMGFGV